MNLDDPRSQMLMAMGLGLLGGQSANFGKNLSQAGLLGLNTYNQGTARQAKLLEEEQQRKMREMQMAEIERGQQFNQALAKGFQPGQIPNYPSDGMGPALPGRAPGFDFSSAVKIDPMRAMQAQAQFQQMTAKAAPRYEKVGDNLVRVDTETPQTAWSAPEKPHWLDRGDSFVPVDRTGKPIGPAVSKNISPEAAARLGIDRAQLGIANARLGMDMGRYNYEIGDGKSLPKKQQDEVTAAVGRQRALATQTAQQELPQIEAEAQQTSALIDKLITHPGFKTTVGAKGPTGIVANISPQLAAGTDAADFVALRDQIVGKQFMQAYQSLKGGGQITEVEGKKATDAISRMSTAQSEKSFIEAAKEFQGIINAATSRARAKAGGGWSIQRVN